MFHTKAITKIKSAFSFSYFKIDRPHPLKDTTCLEYLLII